MAAINGFNRYYCPICNRYVPFFLKSGVKSKIFSQLDIVGGGYRRKVKCPICKANDRIRWLDYVIENKTDIYQNADNVILHIAPERCIEKKIRNVSNYYISGDIQEGKADETVDLTNMLFEEAKFDYVIANHVLEHISDERKAIEEIKRVLKPSGKFLFSMPLCESQDTYESSEKLTEADRLKLYGQKDHVRLYGRNTKNHMEGYGLHVDEYIVQDLLSEKEIQRLRLLTPLYNF